MYGTSVVAAAFQTESSGYDALGQLVSLIVWKARRPATPIALLELVTPAGFGLGGSVSAASHCPVRGELIRCADSSFIYLNASSVAIFLAEDLMSRLCFVCGVVV